MKAQYSSRTDLPTRR